MLCADPVRPGNGFHPGRASSSGPARHRRCRSDHPGACPQTRSPGKVDKQDTTSWPGVRKMVTVLIALGFFILIAILGPLLGADSRVPGGWTPIEPGGKLWPGPR